MSKLGYMESEGMKRGSATNQRMRSEKASVMPIVSRSSLVSALRKERSTPPDSVASSLRSGSPSPSPPPPAPPEAEGPPVPPARDGADG